MRQRIDASAEGGPTPHPHVLGHPQPPGPGLRDAPAVAELFLGVFHRDLLAFFPTVHFVPIDSSATPDFRAGPKFQLRENPQGDEVELYGLRYQLARSDGSRFPDLDARMVRAIGAVLGLRYHHLFELTHSARLELYRGGSEDHYVAAFVEPLGYTPPALAPSRIAAAIQTLRTAALSTYENQRVSTGALLAGPVDDPDHPMGPTAPDALDYAVELTALKSIHRLCDGERTLFLVDRLGKLAGIADVGRWASPADPGELDDPLCARIYAPHARATRSGGRVCVVLSPNQEIKVFAEGAQAFAFTHGRWRMLDPRTKFTLWSNAVADPVLARSLFGAALNLAEARKGALFLVSDDPASAAGRLIATGDVLEPAGADNEVTPRDHLGRRALHYLARGQTVADLDPAVLEALASLDGALVADRSGRLIAFGAILRHDPADLPEMVAAEGARTTAALAASRFGPVLKVSEDGVISCFLNGARAWDL